MVTLDVNVAGDLAQRREHLQSIRMHFNEARSKREVRIHLLKPIETLIQYLQRTLDNGAIAERIDIARMNDAHAGTRLRTGTIARYTFTILCSFIDRARSYACTIILQQMFGAITNACRSVSVFTIWIRLPQIIGWIVFLHWWTFLFAYTVIVEIATGETVFLGGSGATASAEQMTTFTWFRSKATALSALRRTVGLAEFLAIVRSFAPTTGLTVFVTRWTFPFRRCKIECVLKFLFGICEMNEREKG